MPDRSDDAEAFRAETQRSVERIARDKRLQETGRDFLTQSIELKYNYNFSWMGLPIIQFPQDMAAMQEIVWAVRPSVIVEAGVARGGSLVFYASLLEMMGVEDGVVIGVDIEIRPHNRRAIEDHPMSKRIVLVEGSSVAATTVDQVKRLIPAGAATIVCLDSMHTHAHVLEELRLYAPLVTPGGYLVVFDTVIEDLPASFFPDRPWGPGDNPLSAVQAFLRETHDFELDRAIEDKLIITCCRGGYLRRKSG